jgi:uncharacterized protein (DUF885 family)
MQRNIVMALLLAALSLAPSARAQLEVTWVQQSNAAAQPLLEVLARYVPETAASLGVEGHDAEVSDLGPGVDLRLEADLDKVAAAYDAQLAGTTDPRLRQDLQILAGAARDQRNTSQLNRRLMLPFLDLPQQLFQSFDALLDPRVDKARYPAALTRLKRYTGRERGYTPICEQLQARISERFAAEGLAGPWTSEVQQSLDNRERFVAGIREVLERSGLEGWQSDLAKLDRQLADHSTWVEKNVMPRARESNQLPPEIYADNLRNFGVRADPRELLQQALVDFVQTRDELDAIAKLVARERGLASSDYRDVIRALKAQEIPNDQLMDFYRQRLRQLEEIVRREAIVTMPERPAVIRVGTEAESAAQPAPHLSPPRLIGNTGEPAEFVLPLSNPNAAPGTKMDDFTYDAIGWTLTVHEARPGHELQYAKMLENGTSTARAVFAFNSANVEGWALYAESVMKQYLPLEGQVGSLQMRLMRCARAFLDPMVNLGLMEPSAAQAFLMREVVLSEPMAKQEVDRYSFRAPGQATSYFYGYQKHLALRARTEIALGDRFDERSYHDFIISQGLLPPELLAEAVTGQYVPAQLAAGKTPN